MLIGDVCKIYGLDEQDFEKFLRERFRTYNDYNFRVNGIDVIDDRLEDILASYKGMSPEEVLEFKREEEKKRELQKKQEELRQAERAKKVASILITSGFNFDGYKVVKYSGYISGDDVARISNYEGLFTGNVIDKYLCDALVKIRRQALQELKEAAVDLGCNAVIGVDYDYITLEPQTNTFSGQTVALPIVICVTANGNAVVIEKTDE